MCRKKRIAHASPSPEMLRLHFKFKAGAKTKFSLLRGPPTLVTSMAEEKLLSLFAEEREPGKESKYRKVP